MKVVDNSNKPSWKTREACEAAIAADPKYLGATPSFISDHYAKATAWSMAAGICTPDTPNRGPFGRRLPARHASQLKRKERPQCSP